MKIAVDAMGGDDAPQVPVKGAVQAANERGSKIILVGNEKIIETELSKYRKINSIEVKHASQVVEMGEKSTFAIGKRDSSIRVAINLLKKGEAQAVVSAGNSGAVFTVSSLVLGKLEGIKRPAIAPVLPTLKSPTVLIDAGANTTCKPYYLVQFAIMGSVFSRYILGKDKPLIGLLSNGKEDSKGNELTQITNILLKKSSLNYAGYVEGRDVFRGKVDVVVTDGFTGNIFLKASEGVGELLGTIIKNEIRKGIFSRLGYLVSRNLFKNLRNRFDYAEHGGAALLGINGAVIISHGRSSTYAIMNAIRVAETYISSGMIPHLLEGLQKDQELLSLGKGHPLKLLKQLKDKIVH